MIRRLLPMLIALGVVGPVGVARPQLSDPSMQGAVACIAQVFDTGVSDSMTGLIGVLVSCEETGTNVGPGGAVMASASATALGSGNVLTPSVVISNGARGTATVTARYFAELESLSPPPSPTSFVPLLWVGTTDFEYSGLSNANASGSLNLSIFQVGGAQQTVNFTSADPPRQCQLSSHLQHFP